MNSCKGDRYEHHELVTIVNSKLTKLDEYELRIRQGVTGLKAHEHHLLHLRKTLTAMKSGKKSDEEILKMVAALPLQVGPIWPLSDKLGVHYGVYYTTIEHEDAFEVIWAIRRSPSEAWRHYDEVVAELYEAHGEVIEPSEAGYRYQKSDGAGFVVCPGWTELDKKTVKMGIHHSCGREFFSAEAGHSWRCPECARAFDRYRKVKKAGARRPLAKDIIARLKK
jgi:hypothetical protein